MKYIYRGQKTKNSESFNPLLIYRILTAFFAIAFIAVLVLLFVTNKSSNAKSVQDNIRAMAGIEMRQAISTAEELNRSGSSTTANTLSKVRQYVHGLEVLNSLSILTSGQSARLFPQQALDNAQAVLDAFISQLQTGQTLGQVLSKLMQALTTLQDNLLLQP